MKALEAVKDIMAKKGIKQSVLRKRLGLESNTMAMRLGMKNIGVEKLNEMLRALDYKLVIMPSDARIGQDAYEVE